LLQFFALWYDLLGILSLVREGDATGVPSTTTFTASTFSLDFSSTCSRKRTIFFFDLGFAFSGKFFFFFSLLFSFFFYFILFLFLDFRGILQFG
jgi:hypothetical protein